VKLIFKGSSFGSKTEEDDDENGLSLEDGS